MPSTTNEGNGGSNKISHSSSSSGVDRYGGGGNDSETKISIVGKEQEE